MRTTVKFNCKRNKYTAFRLDPLWRNETFLIQLTTCLNRFSQGEISSSTKAKRSSYFGNWMLRVRTAALWRPVTWAFSTFIHYQLHLVSFLVPILFCSCFSYMIAQGVCYLLLCEASFPKKMAFAYLEDLHTEFFDQYGRRVPSVTRPYSFIEFGKTDSQCPVFQNGRILLQI